MELDKDFIGVQLLCGWHFDISLVFERRLETILTVENPLTSHFEEPLVDVESLSLVVKHTNSMIMATGARTKYFCVAPLNQVW